ncbi:MAG: thiol peroxidase [Candidatus Omnitrophica bacterium]|nr:thiol peroxidase [Candidatus Omnitrophota bacterium]MDE2008779.1 thiol peroxidase [Candidatus Omnitrophota bacterium]MDE2213658.1 thiol peroxidase [Candidatus Omnitrophota bacterium]MDE2230441.1 thiol peroxidase [Candidatus Omnitrophota bacterium]
MAERVGAITMKGNPLTLTGHEIKAGDQAPDATLVANDLSEVKLSSFKGKKVILSSVPSLDTPVCDLETKRFNQEASKLSDVAVLTISKDLPFAQKRWCGANGATAVKTLSDYRGNFGETYGVLIKGLNLLARCIFVINEQGRVTYVQLVKEVASEPNYDEVLKAVKGEACGCGGHH